MLKFHDAASAYRSAVAFVQRATAERGTEGRALALATSIDRYESVIQSHWSGMQSARDKDSMVILRAQGQLDRVQRLGEVETSATVQRTIVIAGTPEQYAAKLREIVAARKAGRTYEDPVDAEVVETTEGLPANQLAAPQTVHVTEITEFDIDF